MGVARAGSLAAKAGHARTCLQPSQAFAGVIPRRERAASRWHEHPDESRFRIAAQLWSGGSRFRLPPAPGRCRRPAAHAAWGRNAYVRAAFAGSAPLSQRPAAHPSRPRHQHPGQDAILARRRDDSVWLPRLPRTDVRPPLADDGRLLAVRPQYRSIGIGRARDRPAAECQSGYSTAAGSQGGTTRGESANSAATTRAQSSGCSAASSQDAPASAATGAARADAARHSAWSGWSQANSFSAPGDSAATTSHATGERSHASRGSCRSRRGDRRGRAASATSRQKGRATTTAAASRGPTPTGNAPTDQATAAGARD